MINFNTEKTKVQFNPELAEITGLLLGDGCLSSYVSGGRQRFEILFTGNAKELRYYKEFVCSIFQKNFGVDGYIRLRKDDNTVRYHIRSKRVFNFFKKLRIPVGKRGRIKVPPKIKNNRKFWIPFVRGVFDAEGSIYKRYSKRYANHPRIYDNLLVIQLKMKSSLEFMNFIKAVLKQSMIKTNKIIKQDGIYVLRITNQSYILRFLKIVKPKVKIGPIQYSFSIV